MKKADIELQRYRLAICEKCEHCKHVGAITQNSICGFCGCLIVSKVAYMTNHNRCNKGKW